MLPRKIIESEILLQVEQDRGIVEDLGLTFPNMRNTIKENVKRKGNTREYS